MKRDMKAVDLDFLFETYLQEDEGNGDHTSLATVSPSLKANATIIAKQEGLIAGVEVVKSLIDSKFKNLSCTFFQADGDPIRVLESVGTISGEARALLLAERLILNIMQRMSGIASYAYQLNELVKDTGVRLLDTRKTTPGFRIFEKQAVAIGGGFNHRFGLFDMILIKENHISCAGGIKASIQGTTKYLKENNLNLPVEIEVQNLEELREVVELGQVQRIMLDNFTPQLLKEAVAMVDGKFETEASGGITGSNILKYAETGVDYISIGALTHSACIIDLSMMIETG